MYAVMKQSDVTAESRMWAEWENDCFVQHTTREGAEKALAAIAKDSGVPEDRDPGAYAGLSVQEVRGSALAIIKD